jgi:hypothetical protein
MDMSVIVKQRLPFFRVAAAVGGTSASHQEALKSANRNMVENNVRHQQERTKPIRKETEGQTLTSVTLLIESRLIVT